MTQREVFGSTLRIIPEMLWGAIQKARVCSIQRRLYQNIADKPRGICYNKAFRGKYETAMNTEPIIFEDYTGPKPKLLVGEPRVLRLQLLEL